MNFLAAFTAEHISGIVFVTTINTERRSLLRLSLRRRTLSNRLLYNRRYNMSLLRDRIRGKRLLLNRSSILRCYIVCFIRQHTFYFARTTKGGALTIFYPTIFVVRHFTNIALYNFIIFKKRCFAEWTYFSFVLIQGYAPPLFSSPSPSGVAGIGVASKLATYSVFSVTGANSLSHPVNA